jgi:hypothetical protein
MLGVIEAAPEAEAPPLCPAAPLWRTDAVAGCVGRGLSGGGDWLVAYDCAVDGPPAAVFALIAGDPWWSGAVDCTAVGRGGASCSGCPSFAGWSRGVFGAVSPGPV